MSGIVTNSFAGWGGVVSTGGTRKFGPSVHYHSFSGSVHQTTDTTYSGTSAWFKPAGVTMVYIELVGGGGGGTGSGSGGASDGGAGGGGGAFARQLFPAESLPDSLDIQVGRGGTAGAVSANGYSGGESKVTTPSSFSADPSKVLLRAFGGGPGGFAGTGGAGGGGGGTATIGGSTSGGTTAGEGGNPSIGGVADTGNVIGGRGGRGGEGNSQGNAHTTGGNAEYGGGGGSCGGAGGYTGPQGDAKGGGGSIYGAGGGGGGGGRDQGDSAAGGLWGTYTTGTSALVTAADGISRGYGCGDGGGAKGGGRDGGTPGGGGAGSGSHAIDGYYGSGWEGSTGGPGVVRIFSW